MKEHDLRQAMDKVQITNEMQQTILCKVKNHKKEAYAMSKMKICLTAAAATMILGVAVFAGSNMIKSWNSSSSSIPDYTSLPTAEKCVEDAGYAPVLLSEFENGYAFEEGSVVQNNLKDASDRSVEKFKSFSFEYEKGGEEVWFSAGQYVSEMTQEGELAATIDGIDVYYTSYTNKMVPANYEMTAEDKKAEENGDLVFSYGAIETSVSQVQGVSWEENGIHYNLTHIDGSLSQQELVDMAQELITQ